MICSISPLLGQCYHLYMCQWQQAVAGYWRPGQRLNGYCLGLLHMVSEIIRSMAANSVQCDLCFSIPVQTLFSPHHGGTAAVTMTDDAKYLATIGASFPQVCRAEHLCVPKLHLSFWIVNVCLGLDIQ